MDAHGAFLVCNWTSRGGAKHASRFFRGEMKSKNGYAHRRSVEVTDKGYRVKDFVKGDKAYKVLFHTPCDVAEENGALELRFDKRPLCRIRSSAKPVMRKACRSLYYLKKEEIVRIEFSADADDAVVTEIEVL